MKKMIILRGLPASGKSTYAREIVKSGPNFQRVNRDEIRWMLDANTFQPSSSDIVNSIQEHVIRTALARGTNIIVDNTHLLQKDVKSLHKIAEDVGDVEVLEVCFTTSYEECIRRNSMREGVARVPHDVMERFRSLLKRANLQDKTTAYPFKHFGVTPYKANGSLPKAVICDLDGTLALLNGRDPYDATDCDRDLPNPAVVECLRCMYYNDRTIIFCSGREDKHRDRTMVFLQKHCDFIFSSAAPKFELYMRKTNDFRRDATVKREIFDNQIRDRYAIDFVLDDRDSVVKLWRAIGLATFQVNYGNF